jgi:hypothetical protein
MVCAPKGQESLAQGLPWVMVLHHGALKGLEFRSPKTRRLIQGLQMSKFQFQG